MPIQLSKKNPIFPDVEDADDSGLLAVGGDLHITTLIHAYSKGIFPWYEDGMPILWWSPDPRMVIFPHKMIISHSLKQSIKKKEFEISIDKAFEEVIENCSSTPRKGEEGTWITPEMKQAYIKLHKEGLAHSVEAWQNNELVGGFYGVALGKMFFGESMFHKVTNASKVALFHFVEKLKEWDFKIIDAQMYTNHLESLGGELIARGEYIKILNEGVAIPDMVGSWENRI